MLYEKNIYSWNRNIIRKAEKNGVDIKHGHSIGFTEGRMKNFIIP